eukprot:gene17045-8556_t
MAYEYITGLNAEARNQYLQKLEAINLRECQYRLPADAWLNNPTQWPNIEYPNIYDYLINTPGLEIRAHTLVEFCLKLKQLCAWVLWGQESESKALKKYQEKALHTNVMVSRCGLMLDQEHPFLGASADAIGH